MRNGNLDVMDTVSVGGVERSEGLVSQTPAPSNALVAMFNRFDGWAQRYFSALARARNRQSMSCHCEW